MSTHTIALITDSACDLPDALLDQYGIAMVPLFVLWGEQELRDRVDIMPEDFYRRLVSDPVYPKTSQPAPQHFAEAVKHAEENGADEAVIITISSGMSSTHNSALQGLSGAGIPVHVVDSKANSMSQGWQVLAAARARTAGGTAAEMIAAADRVRKTLVTLLVVNTLEYLHKGGRISVGRRLIGTALNLKPQLLVNHDTGRIEAGSVTRTRDKALEKMYRTFFDRLDTSQPLHVAVLHGNAPDDAERFAARIKAEYAPVELVISMTSPVMGVHTGPGALALCGYAGE